MVIKNLPYLYRLVKHLVSSKEDKKRAYETLQSVGLASGKVRFVVICGKVLIRLD